jgi:hypothetical protein
MVRGRYTVRAADDGCSMYFSSRSARAPGARRELALAGRADVDDPAHHLRKVAAEAVGERLGGATPEAVKDKPEMPTEEALRQRARSAGPQASLAVRTAESVDERVGDAVRGRCDGRGARAVPESCSASCDAGRVSGNRCGPTAIHRVAVGFALGYAAALLIHRRG